MHTLRQKCRPKHQILILKCYPKTTKGAVDVRPNSSELSYLLYYATTRRSKVQKVGEFLEKKTANDVWRARIGNVQVTLQILAALIEKVPLYAPHVLKILNIILPSRDITMVESSIPTFEAFCDHHDASLTDQYEEVVRMYASFASTRSPNAPVAMRWRSVGLRAIKSVASSEALARQQLDVVVPVLLENVWSDDGEFLDTLADRAELGEKMLRRRTSIATVRTVETSTDNPLALSGTIADADKLAEEDIGVLSIECLKHIFVVNNRPQIHGATTALLTFIADRVAQDEKFVEGYRGWALKIYEMIARWTPVQDRYVILVTAMDRIPLQENNLQELVLATMVDSLLRSDINLIGLSVMDVLLGLIRHVLKVLQQKESDVGRELLSRLQACIGNLATHVYYADQVSDMVSAILLRLKQEVAVTDTDGFFSSATAKVNALEAIKAIFLVASHWRSSRNRVPLRVWEGTQWLLRDSDGRVRLAYVDALLTWLERVDLRAENLTRTSNSSKRAVSNTFLQLLHLAAYDNALEYVDSETDIVLLHLLLTTFAMRLGVDAVQNGLPMIFRLQEDIMEVESPIAKIRIGSLCHGYFWGLSEKFDFDTSPVGRAIQDEIYRRRKKNFWVDRITVQPLALAKIGTPGQSTPQQALPLQELESGSLLPFDDRFQMVKLISLSYSESLASPPSAPTSPGRSFTNPAPAVIKDTVIKETVIKETMMSEWSRESVITVIQESSKTVSLNGSRSVTNARNFLAVNGKGSGSQSPAYHKPNSTHGLGAVQKLRKTSAYSPSPESSRNSITRVDQLKLALSGQPGTSTKEPAHSDASSDSMLSYDFTASEVSFNPGPQSIAPMERSVSLRGPNDSARSRSRDRASPDDRARPLTSNPVLAQADKNVSAVPPVPPLPHTKDPMKKSRSVSTKTKPSVPGEDVPVVDLESLLNGIDAGGERKGSVVKPPY